MGHMIKYHIYIVYSFGITGLSLSYNLRHNCWDSSSWLVNHDYYFFDSSLPSPPLINVVLSLKKKPDTSLNLLTEQQWVRTEMSQKAFLWHVFLLRNGENITLCVHSGQTQKPTSHLVVSALKICISSKRLRSEVCKKALLEIRWQNKVRGDKVRGKQTGTFPQILNVYASLSRNFFIFWLFEKVFWISQ